VPAPNALIMAFGETAIELELWFWIQDAQNGVHNIKSQVLTRSGDCFSSKAFAFHTPSGIFMYAPMRRPLLLRLVIGDIAHREAVRAVISSFSRIWLVAGGFERLRHDRYGRLAHADGRDEGGEQAKYGERV